MRGMDAIKNMKTAMSLSTSSKGTMQIKVEEILKQTILMNKWVIATTKQTKEIKRIADSLEKMAKK